LRVTQFYPSKAFAANGVQVKLHLNTSYTQKIFTAHGSGYVVVSGERYEHSLVVAPEHVLTDWRPENFESLEESHFTYFLTLKPEILLVGTGTQQRFGHPRLYQALIAERIGVEFMDTPAACRTYNILMAEDRKVLAAIIV
jgi:uncharacterized protein